MMKRTFIAIKIEEGDALMKMLSEFRTVLKNEKISWARPGNLHLTLLFLGNTGESEIKSTGRILEKVCKASGGFELVLKGAGVFKNMKDPRVIWTGIENNEKLMILNREITSGLRDTGLVTGDQPYSPHLTLGRIRSISDIEMLKNTISAYSPVEIQRQYVDEIILYESVLLPAGPIYKPLRKFSLA